MKKLDSIYKKGFICGDWMLELMISDISKSLSHRHHCDVEQTTKCWRNSGSNCFWRGNGQATFWVGTLPWTKKESRPVTLLIHSFPRCCWPKFLLHLVFCSRFQHLKSLVCFHHCDVFSNKGSLDLFGAFTLRVKNFNSVRMQWFLKEIKDGEGFGSYSKGMQQDGEGGGVMNWKFINLN